jgi:pimeloyl-ACP methyl ester carboxylesterase
MHHRRLAGALVLLAVTASTLVTAVVGAPPASAATYPIESAYAQPGTWAVTTGSATDASGNSFSLYYPSNLGAGGLRHPIVSWGNGTNAVPSQYNDLLTQLASWGFVVVASNSTATGYGTEITAGANYMVAANGNAASAFYQKLDTTKVAAIGHSQGAGGSTRAVIANPGLFTTLVTVALPAAIWVSPGQEYNTAQLTRPTLFLGGSTDWLIASPSTTTGYYNKVPGAAAVGVLKGAGHNTIQNDDNGFVGYITAWLMYQLRGDATARNAFAGTRELISNTNWQNQATKNLA